MSPQECTDPHNEDQLSGDVVSAQIIADRHTDVRATFLQLFHAEAALGRSNLRLSLLVVLAFNVLQLVLTFTMLRTWVAVLPALAVDAWAAWYFLRLVAEMRRDKSIEFAFLDGQVVRVSTNGEEVVIQLNNEVGYKIPLQDIRSVTDTIFGFRKVTLRDGDSILIPREALPRELTLRLVPTPAGAGLTGRID